MVVADVDADVFFVDVLEELQKVGIKIANLGFIRLGHDKSG